MFIKTILLTIILGIGINSYSQTSILKKIESAQHQHEKDIYLHLKHYYRQGNKEEKLNILFIPYLYLNNLDISQKLIKLGPIIDTVMIAVKNLPTIDNLKIPPGFPHKVIIYNQESKRYLGYISELPSETESLLDYYLDLHADLLFYIWGSKDYFVLIDNKIWMLKYDSETKTFTKIEL